jgi:hypothetical protein
MATHKRHHVVRATWPIALKVQALQARHAREPGELEAAGAVRELELGEGGEGGYEGVALPAEVRACAVEAT